MTEDIERFSGGTSRKVVPWKKSRGTKRFLASFVFIVASLSFLCTGCDDEAQSSRETEAAAMEEVIRQTNEINQDFPEKQPETYGEKEDAYKEIIKNCVGKLRAVDTQQCPEDFRTGFEQYIQTVEKLFDLLSRETREKKGFEARTGKRDACLSELNKAKNSVNLVASKYGVAGRLDLIGRGSVSVSGDEALSLEEIARLVADGSASLTNDEDTNEYVKPLPTSAWIMGGFFVSLGIIILVLLIFVLIALMPTLDRKKYEAEQKAKRKAEWDELIRPLFQTIAEETDRIDRTLAEIGKNRPPAVSEISGSVKKASSTVSDKKS